MRVRQGETDWHRRERAHRPGNAHAEVVGVLVLALASVPRERAALLREETAPATRRSRRGRLAGRGRRRCVQERRDAHCEERRRHSALEPISKQLPAAQRLLRKLAEALILTLWEGRCGGAQVREHGQRRDRRQHAAGEAVLGEGPVPQCARSARASRPQDRTAGGAAYSVTSRVSAEMLAGIGLVKPILAKCLIAHSEACGRAEDGPPTRSRCARKATQAPHRRRARPREGGAQERERGQRRDRRRHAAGEAVLEEVPAPQRARSASASRPGDRTGGGAAYRTTSLVSAVMLARIGPVKPLLFKDLIAHRNRGMRPNRTSGQGAAMRSRSVTISAGAPPGLGAHRYVRAVSAEIVGGTLPTRPG
jgi:hypothetical protein